MSATPFSARLPATSANLGPGFDAVGLAMSLYLTVRAHSAPAFELLATGRDAAICGRIENNLLLDTYAGVLHACGAAVLPLAIHLENEIPLGMGCGSSAAALLAGVLLANHFGELRWTPQQVLDEACRREKHPDNVAACFHGGLTVSKMSAAGNAITATFGHALPWRLTLVLPEASLATEKARALLPETYSRADVVANIGSTALLVAAFALGEASLLREAMQDRVHQPYRMSACPLLPLLLPLAARENVFGVALSGAGPAVLLLTAETEDRHLSEAIRALAGSQVFSVISTTISAGMQLIPQVVEG